MPDFEPASNNPQGPGIRWGFFFSGAAMSNRQRTTLSRQSLRYLKKYYLRIAEIRRINIYDQP